MGSQVPQPPPNTKSDHILPELGNRSLKASYNGPSPSKIEATLQNQKETRGNNGPPPTQAKSVPPPPPPPPKKK